VDDIIGLGDCERVFALGEITSAIPAEALEHKCGVPYTLLPYPMGIGATDSFLMALSRFAREEVPEELDEERGQALDLMLDAHPYYYGKNAAVYGDPDTVLGITSLILEMGMIPKYVITGTPREEFTQKADDLFAKFGVSGCTAKASADLFELHQWIKNDPVDLLIGGSHGKYIARAEDIPIVRAGFPILDRYGHIYQPLVGYRGVMRLVEKIANALLDRRDRDCKDEDFEMVM
jgi:nitrogenase molybdenum-iron protein beta chain